MKIGDLIEIDADVEMLGNGSLAPSTRTLHLRKMPGHKVQLFFRSYIIVLKETDLKQLLSQPAKQKAES